MCGGNTGHNHGMGGDYHDYKSHQHEDNYKTEPSNYTLKREASDSKSERMYL